MRPAWEVLAEGPDEPAGPPPWWRVHVPTLVGALVMSLAAAMAISGAVYNGSGRSWLAATGFVVNALALLGVARSRHMMDVVEGASRRYSSLSELGPWGRREWWFTVVSFLGFVVGIVSLVTA